MPTLDQITTGGGDAGTTSLADGQRVAKTDPRVEAYGTVDELNSLLGVVRLEALPAALAEELLRVQNELFDLGADLAAPDGEERPALRIQAAQVARLEGLIAAVAAQLAPATSFVLPGGSRAAAQLHLARAVARRAERQAWAIDPQGTGGVNRHALTYLNRLSDLLFVWARQCNDAGRGDILWRPQATAAGQGDQ